MKKVLLLLLAVFTLQFAYSQENKEKTKYDYFFNNWFINVSGGASVYCGENDRFGAFEDRISPNVQGSLGKWITPYVGARLSYNGWQHKGYMYTLFPNETTQGVFNDEFSHQKWTYHHIHMDMLFDLTDIIWGVKEDRFYSVIPYWGLGFIDSQTTRRNMELTGNLGIINSFRLSNRFDLTLEGHWMLVNDRFDEEISTKKNKLFEGSYAVNIGVTYKFGNRAIKQADPVYIYKTEYVTETVVKHDTVKIIKHDTVEVVKDNIIIPKHAVQFIINRTDLSKMARVNLGFIAEHINKTDAKFKIAGYADKQTGNPTINQRLSIGRAEAVRDCLVKEFGVDPAKLVIEYHGGVGNMFYDDNKLSRATIMEMVK